MIFLQLNPFSKPVAISEMLLLLIAAAFIGWLIARLIAKGRIQLLREAIDERKIELTDCRSQKVEVISNQPVAGKASKTVYPIEVSTVKNDSFTKADDLKLVEGIGPKIEELINKEGIFTFEQLADTSPIRISHILKSAGPRFQMHDPTSWPKQALLAKEGKWAELQILKDQLISGRL